MKPLESSPIENLEGQPKESRFFVIQVLDPETRLYVRGSIAIPPDHQDRLRGHCKELGVEFEEGLPHAAAAEIMHQLWGPVWPEGYELTLIEEVTKDALLERVRARTNTHAEAAS